LVANWTAAREFCRGANSTLPIIADSEADTALRQFILDYNNSTSVNRTSVDRVWLGVRARNDNDTAKWFWINGQPSGK